MSNFVEILNSLSGLLCLGFLVTIVFWKNGTPFERLRDLILAFRGKK